METVLILIAITIVVLLLLIGINRDYKKEDSDDWWAYCNTCGKRIYDHDGFEECETCGEYICESCADDDGPHCAICLRDEKEVN